MPKSMYIVFLYQKMRRKVYFYRELYHMQIGIKNMRQMNILIPAVV